MAAQCQVLGLGLGLVGHVLDSITDYFVITSQGSAVTDLRTGDSFNSNFPADRF